MATKSKKPRAAASGAKWPTKADMVQGLRIGMYQWWHETRALLKKVQVEARQMAEEVRGNPDGPLADLVSRNTLDTLANAVENAIDECLVEIEIEGPYKAHAPSERMYDTVLGESQ